MRNRAAFPLLLALLVSFGSAFGGPGPGPRPALWATPVGSAAVQNLYRVEPDLYRSALPTAEGFKVLETLGVRTVLDLRGGDGDVEEARGTSLRLLHVPMTAWGLKDDRVFLALKILADPQNRPILVHCRHGADRTGAILALYRVVVQGWSKADAIREMNEGGFHHSSLFHNLDNYVTRADVAALRRRLGITAPVASVTDPGLAAPKPGGALSAPMALRGPAAVLSSALGPGL